MLLASPLNCFLLADSESTKLSILLHGVIQLGVDARVPDEIDVQSILEEESVLLLLPPQAQTVGIEGHHFSLIGSLLADITVKQVAKVLRDLIAKLDAHADIRHAAEQCLQHRLGLVSVVVG